MKPLDRDAAGEPSRLRGAVTSLAEAVAQASASLATAGVTSEDMTLVAEQVGRAGTTVAELEAAWPVPEAREQLFVMVHRVNNQLTGVLSLTLLMKEEFGAAHAAFADLDRVDRIAREAAAVVKSLSAILKGA